MVRFGGGKVDTFTFQYVSINTPSFADDRLPFHIYIPICFY